MLDQLPADVRRTLTEFRACEFATLAKDGTPIAWPVIALFQPEQDRFVTTTSIGMPQKAYNARLRPKVSLLYSDSTGSGLDNPIPVLVQGDAQVTERIVTWDDDLDALWALLAIRQPASAGFGADPVTRKLMDWYFMRLLIYVRPRTIRWWPDGDLLSEPQTLELTHGKA